MKIFAIISGLALFATALTVGCHLFEDPYEDLPKDCPLNSGYPCPCDPSDGECDDGSSCVYWGNEDDEGFCSAECDGSDDKEACADTLGYGVIGRCWFEIESDEPDFCVVVCEADGNHGECPPGLKCLETVDGFSACFPPAADESSDDDDDDDDDNTTDECECEAEEFQCGDNDDILYCEDGCNWTSYPCTDVCEYSGYGEWTGDCSYSAEVGHDVCWCI